MGHSQAEKAQSRERIVVAAAKQIREGGLDSLSIGELMRSVNLTHGGFYGHFPSRSALVAAALERALRDGEAASQAVTGVKRPRSLKTVANSYLSPFHRDHIADGCAVSALANDVARADEEVRAIMQARLEAFFSQTADLLGGGEVAGDEDARAKAIRAWCLMAGGIALARVFKGDPASDEILKEARAAVLALGS
ncbi:MAG: TetR/AcrR family transcriptional regulator [Caulobacter sp.]|jgi:TetR/AcrR family transcriptional repressor of nem operon|nr:TetR/AcrR family transcriptional regulator [Caulobacter sp.]